MNGPDATRSPASAYAVQLAGWGVKTHIAMIELKYVAGRDRFTTTVLSSGAVTPVFFSSSSILASSVGVSPVPQPRPAPSSASAPARSHAMYAYGFARRGSSSRCADRTKSPATIVSPFEYFRPDRSLKVSVLPPSL